MRQFKIFILITTTLTLLGAAAGCEALQPSTGQATLQASGLIEAQEVSISPQISGVAAEVAVAEGDTVQAGDLLFRLDGSLLEAERQVAEASVAAAEAAVQTAQAVRSSTTRIFGVSAELGPAPLTTQDRPRAASSTTISCPRPASWT